MALQEGSSKFKSRTEMPRYSLRTLLILLAIGPPLMAWAWIGGTKVLADYRASRNAVAWEDVGGVGSIQFEPIRCFVDDLGSEGEHAADENP